MLLPLNRDRRVSLQEESSLKTAIKTLKYEELFTYMKKVKELKLKNGCKVVARSSGPDASRGVGK